MVAPSSLEPFSAARRLRPSDWSWAQHWFADETLDRALGPLDEEWLTHVLGDRTGAQLVVDEADGRPVGLVGTTWDPTGRCHGITDIAVDPSMRRRGLGRMVLEAAIAWPGHPSTAGWVAFVDPENTAAAAFFTAVGWHGGDQVDGMLRFRTT